MNNLHTDQIKQGLKNIVFLGLVSFFIDLSTEMVYPLVTLYLSTFATASVVGIIEGFAESAAALLKVYSGYLGDKYSNKKRLAFLGYSSAIIYKILLFFSFSWIGILIARLVDRIGKGIRTAPRDALVAESGGKTLGKSFGLHKMLDMLGAGLGILAAYLLYQSLVQNDQIVNIPAFKTIFLLSIIPAVMGLVMLLFVKETKKGRQEIERFRLKGIKLDPRLKYYLLIILFFSLGNSSNAFLVLKASSTGYTTVDILLLYLAYHITASIFSLPLGKLSDRIGRKRLVVPAYLLYGLVYLGFALFDSKAMILILFIIYGLYQAMITGAEKAYITEFAPKEIKGTILGLYGTAQGIGLLFASMIAGGLWDLLGSDFPFYFGGIVGLIAAIASFILMSHHSKSTTEPTQVD